MKIKDILFNLNSERKLLVYKILQYVFTDYFVYYAMENAEEINKDVEKTVEESGITRENVYKIFISLTECKIGLGTRYEIQIEEKEPANEK